MIGVRCSAVTHHFRIDMGTSVFGVLQFLQNQDTCAFTQNKAISLLVEGDRCPGRILSRGQSCQRGKTGHTRTADAAF